MPGARGAEHDAHRSRSGSCTSWHGLCGELDDPRTTGRRRMSPPSAPSSRCRSGTSFHTWQEAVEREISRWGCDLDDLARRGRRSRVRFRRQSAALSRCSSTAERSSATRRPRAATAWSARRSCPWSRPRRVCSSSTVRIREPDTAGGRGPDESRRGPDAFARLDPYDPRRAREASSSR